MFLKKYCPVKNQILWAGGSIGRGNKEYILPGIIEGVAKCKFSLYSNTLDRVDEYIAAEEPILHRSTRLPVWNEMHGVPKPYTRMARVNDSIAIGTYFLPNKAGADVLNIYSSSLLGEFPIGMKSDENGYSGPYEFKIASDENYVVVGYRYIDRIEFFSINPSGNITLSHALGNSDTQTYLYNADRDDEMIKYYSDLFVYGGYLFTLYQGIEDGRLDEACTHLEVYDLDTGRNVANISLGREISELQVMPDIDVIALYSASNPDILYKCRLGEVLKDVE